MWVENYFNGYLETLRSGSRFALPSRISITALPIYKEAWRDRLYEALATLLPVQWEEKVLNPDSDPESPAQDI
jgi:hypothetical protein